MNIWARLFGVQGAIVEDVSFDKEVDGLVLFVRPKAKEKGRCGICHKRCPGFDRGEGVRRWRALDLGNIKAFVESHAPRVTCPEHGVVVAAVPWARHDARFTRAVDDTCAWLATHCSKSAVATLMRVTWRTIGRMVTRVAAEEDGKRDRFQDLHSIGIDEISYRKGQRYITVVVDHVSGRLLWAGAGACKQTLHQFFELLGKDRSSAIKRVSADGASWISSVVGQRCPNAKLCMDPFHVVKWANEALTKIRNEVAAQAKRNGMTTVAKELKGARYVLWKNPENLTDAQTSTLASIAQTNKPLYRSYLLKEQLREVFHVAGEPGVALLDQWISWACRSRLKPFVELSRKIRKRRQAIESALIEHLSNGRVESMNTKIRVITRKAFGFHSPNALIALAMLGLGGLCPQLPGRK